ncbi:hypothetical protein HXY33_01670 [Candidatus Bathyarchaeota archaeon]|nr:hypothetical protein [Candidatus Bathyarchaeota archaeon]
MKLILVKPEDVAKGSAYHFSNEIINELRREKELCVVGFGNAIALSCMAVQLSSNIANVSVKEMSLDYIGAPALNIGGVVIVLGKEREVDWEKKKKELDRKMKLDFSRDGQLIVISKHLSPDQVIPLSLSKLAKSELLKITATGTAINRAALLALELTKGNIAKEPIGIELVALSTIELKTESTTVQGTGIEIYLRKGIQTAYTSKHKEILKILEQK